MATTTPTRNPILANAHPSHDRAAEDWRSDIWRVSAYLEIEDIVGIKRASDLLALYVRKLEEAGCYLARSRVSALKAQRLAHDIKSMSGQLGFEALQRYSADMATTSDRSAITAATATWRSLIDASCEAARFYAMPASGKSC